MFEKFNKNTFLLKNLQSLSYECTGIPDFELTTESDPPDTPTYRDAHASKNDP